MKKIVLGAVVVFLPLISVAFVPKHSATYYEAQKPEVQEAWRKGAMAKIIYRIVDDEYKPLANQCVGFSWQNDYPRKEWGGYARTDTNGIVILQDKVGGQMTVGISQEGYYGSGDKIVFHSRDGVSPLVNNGKWQPYGERRTLVVKRKRCPIDMPTLFDTAIRVPVTNVWLGLDMETFKLMAPYGDGARADMLLRFNSEPVNKYVPKWATMEVSFTNNPHAGFYVLPKEGFSLMNSAYNADTNMQYQTSRTFRIGRMPSEQDILDENSYMVFRTRTTVDDKGRLVSAHYGKIYGPWFIWRNTRARMMFFNTTPNDTNLEDMHTFKESEAHKW